jgi:hypothetical protein
MCPYQMGAGGSARKMAKPPEDGPTISSSKTSETPAVAVHGQTVAAVESL